MFIIRFLKNSEITLRNIIILFYKKSCDHAIRPDSAFLFSVSIFLPEQYHDSFAFFLAETGNAFLQ